MKKGIFITFEGPEGSGKTSVSSYVVKELLLRGYDVVSTREPGGIEIAEEIRQVILDPKNTKMDVRTEALLYAASRRQHLIERVRPALAENKVVICDRFIDSSLAYQGHARNIGIDEVLKINEFAIEGLFPDLTIYFDINAEAGLKRIKNRNFLDRLDQEDISFHNKVVEGYAIVNEMFKDRIQKIDASQSLDEVREKTLELILAKVSQNV